MAKSITNKNFMIILMITFIGIISLLLTGCVGDSASTVSHNISREADEFKIVRRITFINLRDGEYLFTMQGRCSVQDGDYSETNELSIICQVGPDKYQKHMLYIAQETTYVIEQLESADVSRYDYEFIFRPKAIIPIEIKTETEGH